MQGIRTEGGNCRGQMEIRSISKSYGLGPLRQSVIKDCSFTLECEKLTVLIGPSGCGKTTLLKTFNRGRSVVPRTFFLTRTCRLIRAHVLLAWELNVSLLSLCYFLPVLPAFLRMASPAYLIPLPLYGSGPRKDLILAAVWPTSSLSIPFTSTFVILSTSTVIPLGN